MADVVIPAELARALERHPLLAARFDALPPSHQREYCDWIDEAKKPETRVSRADQTLEMLARGS